MCNVEKGLLFLKIKILFIFILPLVVELMEFTSQYMSSLKQQLEDEINSRKSVEALLFAKELELKRLKEQIKNTSSSVSPLISHLTLPHYIKSIFENADEL